MQAIDDEPIYPVAYRWVKRQSSPIDVLVVKNIVKPLRRIKDIVKLKWPIAKTLLSFGIHLQLINMDCILLTSRIEIFCLLIVLIH